MGDWYPDAEASIDLCKQWAEDSTNAKVLKGCRFYLFGSAIYLEGEQFDALRSDLDIVCVLPDGLPPVDRVDLMVELKTRKAALELEMIPKLQRDVCDEPGVSIVALTPFEVAANIHKSGARSFFDKNLFFDLKSSDMRLGLDGAGIRAISETRRQALEFCQKLRNDFLAVSANNTGGLSEYRGLDPMPKALTRCAAQIVPDLPEGAWYDTRHGLEYLFLLLSERRDEHLRLRSLYKTISIRRGGKGRSAPLSADEQLLLSELLFDQAIDGDTEEVIIWEVRITSSDPVGPSPQQAFEAIRRLIPDARLRGSRQGSIVLTLSSSLRAFQMFEVLFRKGVLKEAIGLEVAEVQRAVDGDKGLPLPADGHLRHILSFLENWRPSRNSIRRGSESTVVEELKSALGEHIASDPALTGGSLLTRQLAQSSLDGGRLDLTVSWGGDAAHEELIGIEVCLVRTMNRLYKDLELMMRSTFPTILLVVADGNFSASVRRAILHLRRVNANLHVVLQEVEVASK